MSFAIEVRDLSVRYGDVAAVDGLTLSLPAGAICALLGRNGAGKTTLLSTLAAFRRPTSGAVLVDGEDPYENPRVMSGTCLVRSKGDFDGSIKVGEALAIAGSLRPRWDDDLAQRLADRFALPRRSRIDALSQGMRSALVVTIGLAGRSPLTMFDEPHLGMDAPSRYAFYQELLDDYLAHPRTIVLSTHLIEEVATLFEDVAILDHGRLLLHEPAEELRARGAELTGPAEQVEALVAGATLLSDRSLGRTRSVVVLDDRGQHDQPGGDRRARAAAAGVDVGPLPLQDLFVHLTAQEAPR